MNSALFIFLSAFLVSSVAGAAAGITYHGRILKPDDTPVISSSVQFRLQVRSPGSENCLLYEELQTKNMSQSNGIFALTINDGSGTRTDPAAYALDRIFQNRGVLTLTGLCTLGNSYTPNPADGRKLAVEFNDGTGWEPMPALFVNYVPLSIESMSVGGFGAENFLRAEGAGGSPAAAPALNSTQISALLSVINSGNIPGNAATATTATTATNATTAVNFSGSLAGDVTGTQSATLVTRLQGRDLVSTAPANGEVLKWNGTAWAPAADATGGGGGSVTAVTASSPLASSGGASPDISLAAGALAGQTLRWGGASWGAARLNYQDLVNNVSASPWPATTCSSGSFLTWNSASDSFACTALTGTMVNTALGYTPLNPANNLSELANASTARTNLGLGTAATKNFGTAVGNLVELDGSAKIPAALLPSLTAGDIPNLDWSKITTGKPTTLAGYGITDAGDFHANGSVAMTGNLRLNNNWLSNDGDNEGLRISNDGQVGIGTASPATSALLDLSSTSRGFLPPRMTTAQRNAISSPTAGLVIYNTTTSSLQVHDGTNWVTLSSGSSSGSSAGYFVKSCPAGYTYYRESCYKFVSTTKNYATAEADCQAEGSQLAEIGSSSENTFVTSLFPSTTPWIGLRDIVNEGYYVWPSGSPFPTYRNWTSGEPNNGGGVEDCGQIWSASTGEWNDGNCTGLHTSVCEQAASAPDREVYASCKAALDAGQTTSGIYVIDPDGKDSGLEPMQAYCDMTTDGGGWTLVMNYNHLGGTNPATVNMASSLPLLGNTTLGNNEAGTVYWGHSAVSIRTKLAPTEARFYCETTGHSRILHFKTSHVPTVWHLSTGVGSASGLQSNFTALSGHTANLPAQATGFNANLAEVSIRDHLFYRASTYHFLAGISSRWECDDYPNNSSQSTIHQVWVR